MPLFHGHNVFVEIPEDSSEMEWADLKDLGKYANMFYNYRPTNVWSAPECLKQKKAMLEPTQ